MKISFPRAEIKALPIGSALLLFCLLSPIVTAESSEASLARWKRNLLAGTGSPPLPYQGVEAFPGLPLNRPVDLDRLAPSDKEASWILTELDGRIWAFSASTDGVGFDRQPVYQFDRPTIAEGKKAVLRTYSIEFHPNFPARPWVFVSLNERAGGFGTNRVVRFEVDSSGRFPTFVRDSRVDLLSWTSHGHDGCDLKFGPDGLLYASSGDGEPPGDPANIGQKTDNLLGSILRIDVDTPDPVSGRPYRIPPGNPFARFDNIPPEVWAYGLRNPWRMNFHPRTGELFLGDNGDEHWELVRRVTSGSNHGWSAYEGSHPFRLSNPLSGPTLKLTTPVWEHPHTEMRSVIGGLFYEGKVFPDLEGHYVYGCYFTKKLWAFEWDSMSKLASKVRRIADLGHQIVSFSQDENGEILVITHDGPIYRLEAAPPGRPRPIPTRLSDTGLFSDTARLQPEAGVNSYRINAEPWADGARVTRHFGIPPGDGIHARRGESQRKSWDFPNGSAFSRTLAFPSPADPGQSIRVETQVMHRDREEWRFLTYRWRADQSDADLVPESGDPSPFKSGELNLTHRFASRGECSACHTQRSFFLLGMSTEQLNLGDQIPRFVEAGFFQGNQQPRIEQFPPLASPLDETRSLDQRARSYLHVNCAHCHRETGLGGRAEFQLLHWLNLSDTKAVDARPLVGLPGLGDECRVIAPGSPDHSELVRRMAIRGPNQMPLIGSAKVDQEGLALIREWISSLSDPKLSSEPPSQECP